MHLRRLPNLRYCYRIVKDSIDRFPNQVYYLENDEGLKLSFWNDIPLEPEGDQITCCVEIPRDRLAKMEVIKEMKHHPIMQDVRNNLFTKEIELRHYAQFPYFNYGFLPQTWESILLKSQEGHIGDNDPVDIVELGTKQRQTGSVFRARILGSFCLIDQGEVDWKILVLNSQQAKQKEVKELKDLPDSEKVLLEVKRWFKNIKTFDGKRQNYIAFDGKIFTKEQTIDLVKVTHNHWKELHQKSETEYSDLRGTFMF